jgi:MFS superfamily sulfate permease-like transporter
VREAIRGAPSTPHDLVLDAEGVTDVDSAGLEALGDLCDGLARDGVTLRVARMKTQVRDELEDAGLAARIGQGRLHPTVRAAVRAAVDGEKDHPDGTMRPGVD